MEIATVRHVVKDHPEIQSPDRPAPLIAYGPCRVSSGRRRFRLRKTPPARTVPLIVSSNSDKVHRFAIL